MVGRAPKLVGFLALLFACAMGAAPAHADRLDMRQEVQSFWTSVQDSRSLRDRLFGRDRREETAVARFTSQGGPAFILDQLAARTLLRYEGSDEIWALRPTAGIRGDIYYRNDVGEVVLRATRLGGLTLYTASSPGGLPCALDRSAQPLRMPTHDIRFLLRHFMRESARAGQAMDHDFEISARGVEPDASDIFGDAATVAVDGVVRMSQSNAGRERVTNLRTMLIVIGSAAGARREGTTLIITVNPRLGPAGRPSSARVMRALG